MKLQFESFPNDQEQIEEYSSLLHMDQLKHDVWANNRLLIFNKG